MATCSWPLIWLTMVSGVTMGVWGENTLHFCQDSAQDFFEIDEKIIDGGGVVANLYRSRGCCQKISVISPIYIALATPLTMAVFNMKCSS